MGSDLWVAPKAGRTFGQDALLDLNVLRQEGMANIDIIRSATVSAADLMGAPKAIGEIASGFFAEMIAVTADPLQDITSLQHVAFVMKGAVVVKDEFRPTR